MASPLDPVIDKILCVSEQHTGNETPCSLHNACVVSLFVTKRKTAQTCLPRLPSTCIMNESLEMSLRFRPRANCILLA